MALDEVLLETAPQFGKPVLRFYQWSEPAATFGYFQQFACVERLTSLRPLIRRPTGGGLVPHDADWTYSLIFPPAHPWYRFRAIESYRCLHQWIQAGFRQVGLQTQLSPGAANPARGQCFIGAEQFDLVWHDRKIAGAAQRRTRSGLLVQGSIQPPPNLARTDWENAFCEIAIAKWRTEWLPFPMNAEAEERIRKLAHEKYATRQYNERR